MKFVFLPESLVPGKVMYVFGFDFLLSIYLHLDLTKLLIVGKVKILNDLYVFLVLSGLGVVCIVHINQLFIAVFAIKFV
jgi:hypothetical protein